MLASADLHRLFQDPDMFDSSRDWRKEGFAVEGDGDLSDIMVGSHASASGYLFKKYSKKISLKDQLKNYRRRIEGAEKLREVIVAQRLTRITVPQKHLHELPSAFSRHGVTAHVLVVEKLDIVTSSDSKRMFRQLDNEGLRQLCTVLRAFRGLDSGARNVPFTSGGQIAFIDTERWDESTSRVPLRRIREYLSSDQRVFAEAIFAAH